jgi:hypothetical protein
MLKKVYLNVYRSLGLAALCLITGALIFYSITFGFFLFNTTWVAPTVLSPSDAKVIQARDELIRQRQFYDSSIILRETRMQELSVLKDRETQLEFLKASLDTAMHTESKTATESVRQIDSLVKQKRDNINELDASMKNLDGLMATNNSELAARLITKDQWTERNITYHQLMSTVTTNRVEVKALSDQRDMLSRSAATLNGQGTSAVALDIVSKKLEVQNEIDSTMVQMITKRAELLSANQELERLSAAENILNQTPYAKVLKTNASSVLGFVSYDNSYFTADTIDVYACRAIFLFCYKVGTVGRKYNDEQIIEFPIFNTRFTRTVKGVFVEFNLADPAASHEQILFLGEKPFFI